MSIRRRFMSLRRWVTPGDAGWRGLTMGARCTLTRRATAGKRLARGAL